MKKRANFGIPGVYPGLIRRSGPKAEASWIRPFSSWAFLKRAVDAHGCIEFNGAEYFIRRKLERPYVVATLSTHHRRVFIKYDGKVIKTFPFPFIGKVVDPIA